MRQNEFIEDPRETADALRPSLALVQDGRLVGTFSADEAEAADRATVRIALASGRHVEVYEVDARLPTPPELGTAVDPERLGWTNVGVASVADPHCWFSAT